MLLAHICQWVKHLFRGLNLKCKFSLATSFRHQHCAYLRHHHHHHHAIMIIISFCDVLSNVLSRLADNRHTISTYSKTRRASRYLPFALLADDKIYYVCAVHDAKSCKGWALSIWISVSLKKNTLPECAHLWVLVFAWFWQIFSLWCRQHIHKCVRASTEFATCAWFVGIFHCVKRR